jgi:acetyl esterase
MTPPNKIRFALLASAALLANPVVDAQTQPITPMTTSAEDPMSKTDPDMMKVLNALSVLGTKPIETLTPSEARKQYSATDAVKKVIKEEKLDVDPHKGLSISNSHFADMGSLRLRYYTPENATNDSALPVVQMTT